MKRKTFNDWYQKADIYIPHLQPWQSGRVYKLIRRAYLAGKKHGREQPK